MASIYAQLMFVWEQKKHGLTDTALCGVSRAIRIYALEFLSKKWVLKFFAVLQIFNIHKIKERGAQPNVHERDTQSYGELFFQSCIG